MGSALQVIVTSILPIFLIMGAGFLLNYVESIDPEPLNKVALSVLTPALIIHSITVTALDVAVLFKLTVGVCAFLTAMYAISWQYGRVTGRDGPLLSAFLLVSVFGNTGALGIPLADFAYGDVGRQAAVLFAAVHGTIVFTLGLLVAVDSDGQSGRSGLARVLRYPLVYAVVLAVGVRVAGVVPAPDSAVMETLGLVGEASIPVMLLILGVQLSKTECRGSLSLTAAPTAFRFLVSPMVGIAVVTALGFQHSTVAQVFVLLTCMPVAVAPIIFVVEFASDRTVGGVPVPAFVSASVFVTTLVAVPILTVLVTLLKAGYIV